MGHNKLSRIILYDKYSLFLWKMGSKASNVGIQKVLGNLCFVWNIYVICSPYKKKTLALGCEPIFEKVTDNHVWTFPFYACGSPSDRYTRSFMIERFVGIELTKTSVPYWAQKQ